MVSCSDDEKEITITDFTKSRSITVSPYKSYPYSMMNIWIKGKTNDTILVKLHATDSQPILKLSGEFKERWYTDYYGEGPRTLIFEPYRATEGEVNIKIKL